ncbi:MAG: 30S ribosomal protein S6 [Candidatus Marinimicrobia bacterium]|nr:30S ribosomal protein S6 [Candidatus Neomarinimicrobiota bacterium]
MRYYETLYIINPNYEQERLDKIIGEVKGEIDREEVTVINHRTWGKKRMAYQIQKHKYGTYMLLQFETGSIKALMDFDTFMKLNRGVIRHQTVRLDTRPDVYEEEVPEVKKEEASTSEDKVADKPAETSDTDEAEATKEVSEPVVEEEKAKDTEPEASESIEADEEKTEE